MVRAKTVVNPKTTHYEFMGVPGTFTGHSASPSIILLSLYFLCVCVCLSCVCCMCVCVCV